MKASHIIGSALEIFCSINLILPAANAGVNVAIGRPANQSSTLVDQMTGQCAAGRAVDGNDNPNFNDGSCSSTKDPPRGPNWWRVDLGQAMHIKTVAVTSQRDKQKLAKSLDYFIVGVTNTTYTPVRGCYAICSQYQSQAVSGAKHYLRCSPSVASGRYVIIQQPINGTGYLTLCEVEVYAGEVRNIGIWRRNVGIRMKAKEKTVLKKRSAIQCVGECKRNAGCESVNYRQMDQLCEMNFLRHGATQCDLVSANGWIWWMQVYEFI